MKRTLTFLAFALAAFAQDPAQITPYQLLDARSGIAIPCVGCSIFTYAAGTNTPLVTYTDYTLGTPNTNPVLTNSAGYAVNGSTITGVWVGASCYKFVAKDAASATIWTQDHICDQAQVLKALLASAAGAGNVGFSQSSSYPAGTVGRALQDTVSITDAPYSAVCDGGSTDNTSKIQAALATGKSIFIPGCSSYYGITQPLTLTAAGQSVYGVGHFSKIVQTGTNANANVFTITSLGHNEFRDLYIIPGTVTTNLSILYAWPILFSASDYGFVSGLEVSGHRRGAVILFNSSHGTVTDSFIHDSVVVDSDPASDSGSDLYAFASAGTASFNLFSGNQIKNGSGVGCAIQTSNVGNSHADHNSCVNNVIEGEPVYGILSYKNQTTDSVQGTVIANNQVKNVTGNVAEGAGHTFGACIYVLDSENAVVDGNSIDGCNIYQPTVLLHVPGCIGVGDTSAVTVSNNRCRNAHTYGYSETGVFNPAENLMGRSVWANNSVEMPSGSSAAFNINDVPYLTVDGMQISTAVQLNDVAIADAGINHSVLRSYNNLTISGYTGGIQQTGPISTTSVTNSFISGNTGNGILLTAASVNVQGNTVNSGAGGKGIRAQSTVVNGFLKHNTISGGDICIDQFQGGRLLLQDNYTSGCGISYNGGFGPPFQLDDSATPSVAGNLKFVDWPSGNATATITNFTNPVDGQELVFFANRAVIVAYNAGMILSARANFSMISGDTLSLYYHHNAWWETARQSH